MVVYLACDFRNFLSCSKIILRSFKKRTASTYFAPLTLTLEKAMSMWLDVRFLPRIPASFAHLLISADVASDPFALLANDLNVSSMTS